MSDTPPAVAAAAPAPARRWWHDPTLRALGALLLGAALAATCPLWPSSAQPLCRVVAQAISRADVSHVGDTSAPQLAHEAQP